MSQPILKKDTPHIFGFFNAFSGHFCLTYMINAAKCLQMNSKQGTYRYRKMSRKSEKRQQRQIRPQQKHILRYRLGKVQTNHRAIHASGFSFVVSLRNWKCNT